jgi:hypothetical protein
MTAAMVASAAALVVCAWVTVQLVRESRDQRELSAQAPGDARQVDTATFARAVADRLAGDREARRVEHTIRSVAEELHARVVPDTGRADFTAQAGPRA